ncbi:hypothetical protein MSAN_02378300 [Mycena sanguinolenta]|uniref:Uncharacterized protein n=1 Tax=Mycena sanguinolenta TaxID=230812 RepID=A0A8H6X4Z3_9AGAR|nr:hypothetical protein MSAN_02378300 [Mycena sanguinolenta]
MGPQAESDEEFIVLSTSDYADSESTSHPKNVEPLIKPLSFLPSLLRESFKISGISEARTRKYSETKPRRQATEHMVNKYYNYHITGGFGGSGGEGHTQGGDGGTGQGPTVYFGQPQERESSAFRTIRRGDVKLVGKEVVVNRLSRGLGVRRIYHAEIRGDPGTVTVAMYQGDSAEEEWRKDVAKYELIWHPNIMQIYGLVSTMMFYAMVFHDGIFRLHSQHRTCVRITEPLQTLHESELHWNYDGNAPDEQSPNSWIRYDSHRTNTLRLELRLLFWEHGIVKAWLAQANCIFAELEETAHVEDYVCVYTVEFTLQISDGHNIPEGYLFHIGPSTLLVPIASARRTPKASDFPQFISKLPFMGPPGTTVFIKGCADFTKAKGSIQIVGRL